MTRHPFLGSRRGRARLAWLAIGGTTALSLVIACSSPSVSPYKNDDTPGGTSSPDPTTKPTTKPTSKPTEEPTSKPTDDPDSGQTAPCTKTPPSNACGLVPQCGCNAGETCTVTGDNGEVSCVKAGSVPMGRKCDTSKTGECGAGLVCDFGACRPYCNDVNKGCPVPGGGVCIDEGLTNKKVCTINCALENPSALCGANTCVPYENETDCTNPGTTGEFLACTSMYDCQQGMGCAADADLGTDMYCERFCRVGNATDCGVLTCKDVLTGVPMLNGVKYGVCQ